MPATSRMSALTRRVSGLAPVVAPTVVALALVTGCTVDGTAVRGPVDLDTGKYANARAAALPDATSTTAWAKLRGVRLADHIVFPRDVDASLVELKYPLQPLARPGNLNTSILEADTLAIMDRFEYGFVVTAGTDTDSDTDTDDGFNHAVVRFADERSAATAVTQISDLLTRTTELHRGGEPVTIAGMPPAAVVVHRDDGGKHTMMSTVAVGSFVIYSWADSKSRAWTERVVRSAYEKQKALLEAMGPESTDRDPDPTGLIRGTIGSASGRDLMNSVVWGRRATALLFMDQRAAYDALTAAGIDVSAMNPSRAYKAASPEKAVGWRDFLVEGYLGDTGRRAASPQDLGSAVCVTHSNKASCFIAVDAYVGEVHGDSLLDAQQQISAVYTFLSDM